MGISKAKDLYLLGYCLLLTLGTKAVPLTKASLPATRNIDIPEDDIDAEFRSNSIGVSKVIDLNTATIAYKDHILKTCYIEKISTQSVWEKNRVLIVHPKLLTNEQVVTIGGPIVANFCFGWPSKILRPTTNVEYRRKRSHRQYYFVGRKPRGQSQSQYLHFGNSEPGKAEAESTRQGSKASVYGTNGMGQAQSQSDPFNCADCYGPDQTGKIGPGSLYQPGKYQQSGLNGIQQYSPGGPGSRLQIDGSNVQDPRAPGAHSGHGYISGGSGVGIPGSGIQGSSGISESLQPGGVPGPGQYPGGRVHGTDGSGTGIHFDGHRGTGAQTDGPGVPGQTYISGGSSGTGQFPDETGQRGTGLQIGGPGATQTTQPGGLPGTSQFSGAHGTGPGSQTLYTPDGKVIHPNQLPSSPSYHLQPGQTLFPGSRADSTTTGQQLYDRDGLQRPSGRPGWTGSDTETLFNGGGQGTYQPGQTTYHPGQTTYQPGQITTQPGQTTYQPGHIPSQPGPSTTQPGQTTYQPGETTYQPGQTTYHPGQTTYQPGQITTQPGQTIYQPGLIPSQPGPSAPQPGQTTYQPGETTYQPGQTLYQQGQPTFQPGQTGFQPGQTTYYIPGGIRPRPGDSGTYIPGRETSGTRQFSTGSQGGTFSGQLAGEYQSPTSQGGAFSGSFQGRYNTHGQGPEMLYQGSLPGGGYGIIGIDTLSPGTIAGNGQIQPDSKIPGGISGIHQGTLPSSFLGDPRSTGGQTLNGHTQVYYPGSVTSTDRQGTIIPGSYGNGISTPGSTSIGQIRPDSGYITGITGPPGGILATGDISGPRGGDGIASGHLGAITRTDGDIATIPGSFPGQPTSSQPGVIRYDTSRFPGQQIGQHSGSLPGTQFTSTSHPGGQYPGVISPTGIQQPSGQTTGSSQPSSQQSFILPASQGTGQQIGSLGPSSSQGPLLGQYPGSLVNQQFGSGGAQGPYAGSPGLQTQYGTGSPAVPPGQAVNIYGQQPGAQTYGQMPGQIGSGIPYDGQRGTGLQGQTGVPGVHALSQQTPPAALAADDSDSQAQSSIQRVNNETQASASSSGRFAGGNAQSQVSGSYSGQGSFSASAGTNDGLRGAQTQVSGNGEGALSSSQGQGGKGKSQAQVQLAADTGDTTSSAQTGGLNHGTNTQVQSGIKGGMADAQANGPGSTSSQAQIGFTPYDASTNEDDPQHPHNGGGTASASSGTHAGKSQVQINGKYAFGIRYTGQAQASSANSGFTASEFNLPTMKPIDFTQNKYENPSRQQDKVNVRQIEEAKILQVVTRSTTPPPEEDIKDSDYEDDDYDDPESAERHRMDLVQQQQTRSLMHDALDPLEDIEEPPRVEISGRLKNGDIIQAGQYIPGSRGYKIPAGFRGRIADDSHYDGDSTRRIVYAAGVKTNRHSNAGYGSGYSYQQPYAPIEYGFKSASVQQPKFVSVTKSETGSHNVLTGKKTPSVYYTQSSTCGYFTNACVYSNGKKICMPKPKANADGTPIVCRN